MILEDKTEKAYIKDKRYHKPKQMPDKEILLFRFHDDEATKSSISVTKKIFQKEPNKLTPYEIMYGKQDNDFAYQFD